MKQNWLKNVASLIGLMVFLILAIGSTDETSVEKEVSTQSPSYTISAQKLYADYEANEVAADKKYKGKILVVIGEIDDIGKDITDTIYITLKGNKYFGSIQCFFSKDNEDEIVNLSKGNYVAVKGKCDGKFMNILLRGCTLYQVYK